MYVCAGSAQRGQKRILNPLELELQGIVNCSVNSGNQTMDLLQSTLQPPYLLFFLNCQLIYSSVVNRIDFKRLLVGQFIQFYVIAHVWPLCKMK